MQYICKSPFNENIDCNNSKKSYYCCSTLGSSYKELLMMKAADFWCLSFYGIAGKMLEILVEYKSNFINWI